MAFNLRVCKCLCAVDTLHHRSSTLTRAGCTGEILVFETITQKTKNKYNFYGGPYRILFTHVSTKMVSQSVLYRTSKIKYYILNNYLQIYVFLEWPNVNHSCPNSKFLVAQELWSISILWTRNDVQTLGPCRTTGSQELKSTTVL